MKLEREYVDGNGSRFKAVVTIADNLLQQTRLEEAVQRLANKARGAARQQATALGGAVHVIVHPIKVEPPRYRSDDPGVV